MTEIAYRRYEVFREDVAALGEEFLVKGVEDYLRSHAEDKGWVLGEITTLVENIDMPMTDDEGVIVLDEIIPITVITSEAPILGKRKLCESVGCTNLATTLVIFGDGEESQERDVCEEHA